MTSQQVYMSQNKEDGSLLYQEKSAFEVKDTKYEINFDVDS